MENIAGAQIGSGLQLVGGVLSATNSTSGSSVNGITGATNSNIGEGLYVNTSNYNLNFRNLIAGNNVTFNTTTSGITINSTATGGSGSTTPVISDTYSNIEILVTNNQLVIGQHYLITDHQTKHLIPNTTEINTGSVEPLILLAVSTNKFNNLVYSTLYPEDTIHFDFTNNLCEDLSTPRTGKITYRKDKFNNSCYYDFRNVKFRRWSVNCNVTWNSGSVYTKDSLIKYNNIIYQVTSETTIVDTTPPNNDSSHYCQFLDLNLTSYWSWVNDKNNFGVGNNTDNTNLSIGSYIDCYTFDDGTGNIMNGDLDNNIIYNNEIKFYNSNNVNGFNGDYNNIVIFGSNNYSNVINNDSGDNTIGNYFNYNTIGNDFNYNTIGNSFNSNTIGNSFSSNTIGNGFGSNVIGNSFSSNTIGNGFNYNTIGIGFYSNTIGTGFYSNTIGNYFNSNTIGNNFHSNTIGNYFNSNTIGTGFYSNTIGNSFGINTIGNGFNYNTIGTGFYSNTIGNNFHSNTIGNYFNSNTIGTGFYSNTIGNSFGINTIGNGFNINTIQDKIDNIDFTSATHVYNNTYNKTIFKGSNSNYYLSYFDGTTMIYVAANA